MTGTGDIGEMFSCLAQAVIGLVAVIVVVLVTLFATGVL